MLHVFTKAPSKRPLETVLMPHIFVFKMEYNFMHAFSLNTSS